MGNACNKSDVAESAIYQTDPSEGLVAPVKNSKSEPGTELMTCVRALLVSTLSRG